MHPGIFFIIYYHEHVFFDFISKAIWIDGFKNLMHQGMDLAKF